MTSTTMASHLAREVLEPFAKVAEHDIGTDEADTDFFRPMDRHNRAPRLTVGDLRRARTAYDALSSTPVEETDAKAGALRDLVVRGKLIVPDYHLNWHADADTALVATLDPASKGETALCEVDHCRVAGDCYAQAVGMPEFCQKTERNDYLSDAQARDLFGTEDDETLPDGRVRVCDGEWVRIPGGYYFDKSAGPLHPEVLGAEACDNCAVSAAPPASTVPSEPEAKREAGAGPVGEAMAWQVGEAGAVYRTETEAWEHVNGWRKQAGHTCSDPRPLYARPVDEPGEVERLHAETVEHLRRELSASLTRADTLYLKASNAEAALAETRERLEREAPQWRSIEERDQIVETIQTFGDVTLRNSHPVWVRDAGGRVYEAVWTVDDKGRGYWWDTEGESPADPVDILPHPLTELAALSTQESSAALAGDGKEAAR